MANKLQIQIKQGNSWTKTFSITHNGEPLVLEAGQKLLFDVKKDYDDDPIIAKDISENTTETAGEYIVSLKPSETDIIIGTYYVGLGLQTGDDNRFVTIIDGTMFIRGTAAEREVDNG